MARSRGGSDGWAACLNWGLIGCSGLLAVLILAVAASLCGYLLVQARSQDVEKLTGRPTPVRTVEHGGVAVTRLPGHFHNEACVLPDGRLLVVTQPVPSVAMLLGVMPAMLRDFGGTFARTTHMMDSRLVVLGARDGSACQFPLPLSEDAVRFSSRWRLNPLTGQVAVHLSVSALPSLLMDDFGEPLADEIWVASPPSWRWERWLSAPPNRELQPTIWLPDGRALLCLVKPESGGKGYELCRLSGQGRVKRVASVPSWPPSSLGFSKEARHVILVCEGEGEGAGDGTRRVLWVDLRTGRVDERRGPSTDAPSPGPRQPGEVLVARQGLRALNVRTGAERCVVPLDGQVSVVKTMPCPDPRWAMLGLWYSDRQTSVVAACDLRDGSLRALVRAPNARLLDGSSDGRRVLVAVSDQLRTVPFPKASASYLADVHLDWKAIKAAPGTTDPQRLLPEDGGTAEGEGGAGTGQPVERAPGASPRPSH